MISQFQIQLVVCSGMSHPAPSSYPLVAGPEWTDNPPDNTRGAAYPEGVLSFSSTEVELFPFTHGAINREFANSVSGDILTLNIGAFA